VSIGVLSGDFRLPGAENDDIHKGNFGSEQASKLAQSRRRCGNVHRRRRAGNAHLCWWPADNI